MLNTLLSPQQLVTARKVGISLLLATPLLFCSVATQAQDANNESAGEASPRYELNRSDTLLLMNIEADESVKGNANFLHLENVYTGQTYRLKMRSGTHLLKMEAGVYRADLDRLNKQLNRESKNGLASNRKTEITLMPQSVNFAGTWHFEKDKKSASLTIDNSNNPAVAVAKKYPVLANYPLRAIKKNNSQMAALDWPFSEDEMLSLRQ